MGTSREDATRGWKHRGLDQPSKQARCKIHRMHPEGSVTSAVAERVARHFAFWG
jgi:hypothetical protein